jgi:hypothetical protein
VRCGVGLLRGGSEQRLTRRGEYKHSGHCELGSDSEQQVAVTEHGDRSQRSPLRAHRGRRPDLDEDHAQEGHRGRL